MKLAELADASNCNSINVIVFVLSRSTLGGQTKYYYLWCGTNSNTDSVNGVASVENVANRLDLHTNLVSNKQPSTSGRQYRVW
jgi:hypothetical protein